MDFKNARILRFSHTAPVHQALLEDLAGGAPFTPCGPTQELSYGFVPPRGEHEAFVENVDGTYLLRFAVETRTVPGQALAAGVKEAAAEIERTTGRKPGKKEMRSLREDVKLALLPRAFPKRADTFVLVDTKRGWLVVYNRSMSVMDSLVTSLVTRLEGLQIAPVTTNETPSKAMANWLLAPEDEDMPDGIDLGSACELKARDESKAVVKFKNHHLRNDIVRRHITEGKLPVALRLNVGDHIRLTMHEDGSFSGVEYVGDAREMGHGDDFLVTALLAVCDLSLAADKLIDAMGGYYNADEE